MTLIHNRARLDRTGRLDRDEFWRDLFSTKGPFDMRPYREKLTDEEKDLLGVNKGKIKGQSC